MLKRFSSKNLHASLPSNSTTEAIPQPPPSPRSQDKPRKRVKAGNKVRAVQSEVVEDSSNGRVRPLHDFMPATVTSEMHKGSVNVNPRKGSRPALPQPEFDEDTLGMLSRDVKIGRKLSNGHKQNKLYYSEDAINHLGLEFPTRNYFQAKSKAANVVFMKHVKQFQQQGRVRSQPNKNTVQVLWPNGFHKELATSSQSLSFKSMLESMPERENLLSSYECRLFTRLDDEDKIHSERISWFTQTSELADKLVVLEERDLYTYMGQTTSRKHSKKSEKRSSMNLTLSNKERLANFLQYFTSTSPPPISDLIHQSILSHLYQQPTKTSTATLLEDDDDQESRDRPMTSMEETLKLESDLYELVLDAKNLSGIVKKQQLAIWELIKTEHNHIGYMRDVIDKALAILLEISKDLMPEIDLMEIFSNLEHVYTANVIFWIESVKPVLEHSRATGQVLDPSLLKGGFDQFASIFAPYKRFCIERGKCREYTQKLERENELFQTFVNWFNGCDLTREGLCDNLAKPFLRLTKYRPVLESIRSHCVDEQQILDLDSMIGSTVAFVEKINEAMHCHASSENLKAFAARIDGTEPVESPSEDYANILAEFTQTINLTEEIALPSPVIKPASFDSSAKLPNRFDKVYKEIPLLVIDRGGISMEDAFLEMNHSQMSIGSQDARNLLHNSVGLDNSCLSVSSRVLMDTQCRPSSSCVAPRHNNSLTLTRQFDQTKAQTTVPRCILKEGLFKLKEAQSKTPDCYCCLLTDMLLITKSIKRSGSDRLKIYRPPVRLDRLKVRRVSESAFALVVLNDWQFVTNFYVLSGEGSIADEWVAKTEEAIALYVKMMSPTVVAMQQSAGDRIASPQTSAEFKVNATRRRPTELHTANSSTSDYESMISRTLSMQLGSTGSRTHHDRQIMKKSSLLLSNSNSSAPSTSACSDSLMNNANDIAETSFLNTGTPVHEVSNTGFISSYGSCYFRDKRASHVRNRIQPSEFSSANSFSTQQLATSAPTKKTISNRRISCGNGESFAQTALSSKSTSLIDLSKEIK